MMRWRQAVRVALERYCARHGSPEIVRTQLLTEELAQILRDAASSGSTPEQTLGRALQQLRAAGVVEFVGRGRYRLRTWKS